MYNKEIYMNGLVQDCSNSIANALELLVLVQFFKFMYCQTSDTRSTSVGNEIVDNSDVVGASPVGAAPTTSSFSTEHMALMVWARTTARWDGKH